MFRLLTYYYFTRTLLGYLYFTVVFITYYYKDINYCYHYLLIRTLFLITRLLYKYYYLL